MSQFPRANVEKPAKVVSVQCSRCYGSGVYAHYGVCFRCGGNRSDPSYRALGFPRDWSDDQCAAYVAQKDDAAAKRREKAAAKAAAAAAVIVAANVAKVPGLSAAVINGGAWIDGDKLPAGLRGVAREIALDAGKREWSEKQAAAVAAGFERVSNAAAERAAAAPVPAGRHEIEGEIVSIRSYDDGRFGAVLKMLVKCAGFRVFGSVPAAISGAGVGDRVRFSADVEPKEAGFGFFKRPSKAAIIAPALAGAN